MKQHDPIERTLMKLFKGEPHDDILDLFERKLQELDIDSSICSVVNLRLVWRVICNRALPLQFFELTLKTNGKNHTLSVGGRDPICMVNYRGIRSTGHNHSDFNVFRADK